jgi:hypothetical protein
MFIQLAKKNKKNKKKIRNCFSKTARRLAPTREFALRCVGEKGKKTIQGLVHRVKKNPDSNESGIKSPSRETEWAGTLTLSHADPDESESSFLDRQSICSTGWILAFPGTASQKRLETFPSQSMHAGGPDLWLGRPKMKA